jgi:hypothetical protein
MRKKRSNGWYLSRGGWIEANRRLKEENSKDLGEGLIAYIDNIEEWL